MPGTPVEEDLGACAGAPVFDEVPVDRWGFGPERQGPDFEEWLAVIEAEHADGRDGFEAPVDPLLAQRLPGEDAPAGGFGYGPRMAVLLDDLAEDESALAMRAAHRARSVEAAREWALTSDEFVLVDARMSGSKRLDWVMRSFVSEIATRQYLSEAMAARLVDESHTLVAELPGTLDALECARISYRHAQVIIEQARSLPEAARGGFEEAVLPEAALLTVAKFRKVAVNSREYLHPDSIAARTKAAVEERYVSFDPAADGMAQITAYLPADRAQALFNRITAIAKSLQGDGDPRTLPQLRADLTCDLLLDGHVDDPDQTSADQTSSDQLSTDEADRDQLSTDQLRSDQFGTDQADTDKAAGDQANTDQLSTASGSGVSTRGVSGTGTAATGKKGGTGKRKGPNWGIRPTVIVTVPLTTLIGTGEEPGNLDGYGPIDPATARRLVALAPTFRRLLIDRDTGVALSLGRKHYSVTHDLRLWLQLRDGVCRFPGCNRPALHSEIDHSRAAGFGGPTDAGNLASLCGPHHRMKHATTWKLVNRGDGILDWTSPTGKVHTTYPATTLPHPSPPGQAVDQAEQSPPAGAEPGSPSPTPSPPPDPLDGPPDPLDEAPPF
jgi:hypothetical protein